MIPKIIHYCWMSGEPYPDLIKECIDTWKKQLPDYQFIKWDSTSFKFKDFPYADEAMHFKKYAFVSDIVRLYALYNIGGIYLDADIKVLKSFNPLLNQKAFTGFEDEKQVGVWLLASEKGNPLFRELLECYNDRHLVKDDGKLDLTPNPIILEPVLKKYGVVYNNSLQKHEYITVYPNDYFSPLNKTTGEIHITENSYAMHLYDGAWVPQFERIYRKAFQKHYQRLPNFIPYFARYFLARSIASVETEGIIRFIKRAIRFLSK
jgi:mannosyltransferase OCH1-like enzyme